MQGMVSAVKFKNRCYYCFSNTGASIMSPILTPVQLLYYNSTTRYKLELRKNNVYFPIGSKNDLKKLILLQQVPAKFLVWNGN